MSDMQTITVRDFTRDFKAWCKAADAGEVVKVIESRSRSRKTYLFHAEKTPPTLLGCMEGTVQILGSLELDEKWEACQ